ncbi:unnamed protein product [Rotaria sp. Silwood1]|nr:unnamed protein product [Rotaria sp. Silwood1]CAF3471507.1 unnamed protein product [Rotaria sp. Silwood1]CAF3516865.1 unnamed protein product [Rotaria sp. Silwood1]CAF4653981.1 unnamed protein product [Rotaria sp. Silwood1]CAF4845833.1 unnamed protein product [Rotaria sp. Silwood1]
MITIPRIQNIESSRVVHELISKPLGTYLIRASTKNDDIVSQIKTQLETNSCPYVVLSVRADETLYPSPIMNYRLPLIGPNGEHDTIKILEEYKQNENNSEIDELPTLKQECIVTEGDTNWEIKRNLFQKSYIYIYSSDDDNNDIEGSTICNFQDGSMAIDVYNKRMKNEEQSFQHEFSILKNLSYFHIVSFYGICYESDQIKYLVFANNGKSLKSLCPIVEDTKRLLVKKLSMIGYQIACGMIYLEYKHIIHRDLHSRNILSDKNDYVRIADFGHAIIKDDDDERFQQSIKNSKLNFQTRRLAPECLSSPPQDGQLMDSIETLLTRFSSKSDVWAYGLIFIELMMKENNDVYPYLPIKSNNDDEIIQIIQHVKLERMMHKKPDNCPKSIYDILEKCWSYNPEDRISFWDIRNEMMRIFKSQNN